MGKRKKRLTMAKYAKKYATIRATVARLKGEEKTIDETPSVQQDMLSAAAAPKEAEVPVEAVSLVTEAEKASLEDDIKEVSVKPVQVIAEAPEPSKTVEDLKAKVRASRPTSKPKPRAAGRKTSKKTTVARPSVKAKANTTKAKAGSTKAKAGSRN